MDAVTTEAEKEFVKDLTAKIQASCSENKYSHLCERMQTEAGLAYVVNRAIELMAGDNIHLSTALAAMESELEGMN